MTKQHFAFASLSILIFLTSSCLVSGQVFRAGSCPKVNAIKDFNATQFVGNWWVYDRYPVLFDEDNRCIHAEYKLAGDVLQVAEKRVDENNKPITTGNANITIESNGQLQVHFAGVDEYLYIGTREPEPKEDVLKEAMKLITDNKLSVDELRLTDLNDCPKD